MQIPLCRNCTVRICNHFCESMELETATRYSLPNVDEKTVDNTELGTCWNLDHPGCREENFTLFSPSNTSQKILVAVKI